MSTLEKLSPGYRTREDTCPSCGGPSTATMLVVGSTTPITDWIRHKCMVCCDAQELADRQRRALEAREQRSRETIAALGIPPLYAGVTLENFQVDGAETPKKSRVVQLARRYTAVWPDVPMITVFVGCPGSGKGHVMWSIARAVAEQGDTARVVVLSDAIRDLREAWGGREEGGLSEAQRLARYRSADLLVIDEVSRHAFYGQPQQHLYDLVAWREIRLKPTILTTNESGAELADFLGSPLSSRAIGWGAPWDFGAEDFRLIHGVRRSA